MPRSSRPSVPRRTLPLVLALLVALTALSGCARVRAALAVQPDDTVNGEIVARAFNQPITAVDPTAHAEVLALRAAAARIGNYRLTGASLYVTVEPCLMCAGALVHARVK